MSLGGEWFVDFDRITIQNKLQSVNFGIYGSTDREILPNDLNKIEFSLVKFESTLMRHFVSQFSTTYTFLNTESTSNENSAFQRYARKMLNYIKAEVNYCFTFWQSEKNIDYTGYRLDATLLRTYYFLLDFHMNVCKRIPNENKSYWTSEASLEDLYEHLAVKYQELVSFIQVFEKIFEELYNKMSPLARSYQSEVNLIVSIWTISNMFFSYSYDDIKRVSDSKFSPEEENKFKERIFTGNEMFKKKMEEEKNKSFEEEQRELQEYLTKEMYSSATITKFAQDFDKESYYLVSKAITSMRQNLAKHESEEEYIETRTKGNFLERLRNAKINNNAKKSIPKRISDFDSTNLSNVSTVKSLTLSQLSSVKESPNNPLSRNSLIHSLISGIGDEHDFLVKIPKETMKITPQVAVSHFNRDILSKLESDAKDHQKEQDYNIEASYTNRSQKKDVSRKTDMLEDEYLRIMNQKLAEYASMKDDLQSPEEPSNQRKIRGIFKSLQIMGQQSSMSLGDPTASHKTSKDLGSPEKDQAVKEDSNHSEDEDDEEKRKKKEKAFKKKYGIDEEELVKLVAEAEAGNGNAQHQPSKENKGDDIPDEQILGDLMEQDSYTETEEEEDDEDKDNNDDSQDSQKKFDDTDRKQQGSEDEDQEVEEHQDHEEILQKQERERRKREKELREKAAAQQAITKNEFYQYFIDSTNKEAKDLKSKYFLPRRNFLYLGDDDNINASRHTSKWCFLQDNYKYQSVEKEVLTLKNEDYSNKYAPMFIERKFLKMKLKRSAKTLSRPFAFAKQNPMSIFQDIVTILAKDQKPRKVEDNAVMEEIDEDKM